ncbi:MAG: ABC transporter ATP-binding protein, partial [Prevotellaceae bacterium]|nr:ABC transporter ATP-binding protein [Prevotellaceae bacterium]
MSKLKKLLRISTEKYSASAIFSWLWKASRGNRRQAILNATVGVLEVFVSLGSVWAIKRAIDTAQYHGTTTEICLAVGVMALLIITNLGLHICGIWIRNILGVKAQNRMQQRMLDRILHSQWKGKEAHHSGDVLNRLEMDVKSVITFITETLPNLLSILVMFCGAFVYLSSMDVWLALTTVGILPVCILLSRFYVRKMRSYTREVRTSDSKVQSILQETIQNRMLIKTLERDDTMVERLDDVQSVLRRQVRQRTTFSVASNSLISIGFSLGYLTAFLWSALRMASGGLSFGSMTAFLQLVYRIQSPAKDLMRMAPAFVEVFTAAERLMELEDADMEEQGDPVHLGSPSGIRLTNVSYGYEQDDNIIESLNFDFRPRTCTAILGETGAGKTTIIRLILALIKPQQGEVTIYNDHRLATISPQTRCNLIYVPQGNTLLSGTIRDNLRLGRLDATDEELAEVLHKACADFVMELPDGLDTKCGESGGGLSEGQAQRIAIARALLREGSVMLLDEATSALDMETERTLLQNLLHDKDKTIIFITHRQAVLQYCDAVLDIT